VSHKSFQVDETEREDSPAYVKHAPDKPNTPVHGFDFRRVLHPLIIGIMVGCIALSVVQFLQRIAPAWNSAYLLIAPILAAFAGHHTYRIAQTRYHSAADRQRLQIIELIVIFLLLKAGSYLDHTLPEIWYDIRRWPEDPFYFLDFQTLTAFALACAAWFSAAITARDLEAVADPLLYKGETGPMERLHRRFLTGGMALLFFSGLARIEIVTLLEPNRPAIRGLALNVLVYFVLGLLVLGQVRYTWLNRLWEEQKYKVSGALNKTWLSYTALFLLIALAVAFVLPTEYTVGLLDIAGFIFSIIAYVVIAVFTLIAALVNFLLSLFFKAETEPQVLPPRPPPLISAAPLQPTPDSTIPWLALLRSVVFWIVALGAIFYVAYSYLKERPEILRAFKGLKVTQMALRWWNAAQRWWRGIQRTFHTKMPVLSLNFLRRKASRQEVRLARRKGTALREQIFYDYLETLERARTEGFPRRDAQTPYEYHHTLGPNLPEAHAELTALTEAFVEARYSAHPIDADDVATLRTNARRVRAALDKLRAQK